MGDYRLTKQRSSAAGAIRTTPRRRPFPSESFKGRLLAAGAATVSMPATGATHPNRPRHQLLTRK